MKTTIFAGGIYQAAQNGWTSEPFRVTELSMDTEGGMVQGWYIRTGEPMQVDPDVVIGTAVTPEMLEAAGFARHDRHNTWRHESGVSVRFRGMRHTEVAAVYMNDVYVRAVKGELYAHELQALMAREGVRL